MRLRKLIGFAFRPRMAQELDLSPLYSESIEIKSKSYFCQLDQNTSLGVLAKKCYNKYTINS